MSFSLILAEEYVSYIIFMIQGHSQDQKVISSPWY